jgi:hypothetical protein
LTNAKIALAGYEDLFPIPLALALNKRGITTLAVQERFLHSFYPNMSHILDKYFCTSPFAADFFRTKEITYEGELIPIGMVRSDFLYRYKKKSRNKRNNGDAKKRIKVIAFHHHTSPDKRRERTLPGLNWMASKVFLEDMIKLTACHPELEIEFRGKDDGWCNIPYFKDVYEKIESSDQLKISRNYATLNESYRLAANADLIIARHTSIADECIAVGIPVLLCEYWHNADQGATAMFNYFDSDICCRSFTELEERIKLFIKKGHIMSPGKYDEIREKAFGRLCDGHVRARLQHHLIQIYEQT